MKKVKPSKETKKKYKEQNGLELTEIILSDDLDFDNYLKFIEKYNTKN